MAASAGTALKISHSGLNQAKGQVRAILVSPSDAELAVEKLKAFPVSKFGSSRWIRQHADLERLNTQAHINAQAQADPYVLEAFITFDKLPCLLKELLAAEIWTDKVLPIAINSVTASNSLRVYYLMHHEAVLVNLLEVFLYHQHAAEALGDGIVDLVDYISRRLGELIARTYREQREERARRKRRRRKEKGKGKEESDGRAGEAALPQSQDEAHMEKAREAARAYAEKLAAPGAIMQQVA